jgi:hypothetical protein
MMMLSKSCGLEGLFTSELCRVLFQLDMMRISNPLMFWGLAVFALGMIVSGFSAGCKAR